MIKFQALCVSFVYLVCRSVCSHFNPSCKMSLEFGELHIIDLFDNSWSFCRENSACISSLYLMQQDIAIFGLTLDLGSVLMMLEARLWIKLENLYIKNPN